MNMSVAAAVTAKGNLSVNWLGRQTSRCSSREKNLKTNVWKIKKRLLIGPERAGKSEPHEFVSDHELAVFPKTRIRKMNYWP